MEDCCCAAPGSSAESLACSACGSAGKPVDTLTVKALLTESALARFESGDYRFCADADCDVVYFAESGLTFSTGDLRVGVWQKRPTGSRPLCYCFGENDAEIAVEIARTGASRAADRIRAHIKAGRCACEVRNPRGACCLADVNTAVERMLQTLTPERSR